MASMSSRVRIIDMEAQNVKCATPDCNSYVTRWVPVGSGESWYCSECRTVCAICPPNEECKHLEAIRKANSIE